MLNPPLPSFPARPPSAAGAPCVTSSGDVPPSRGDAPAAAAPWIDCIACLATSSSSSSWLTANCRPQCQGDGCSWTCHARHGHGRRGSPPVGGSAQHSRQHAPHVHCFSPSTHAWAACPQAAPAAPGRNPPVGSEPRQTRRCARRPRSAAAARQSPAAGSSSRRRRHVGGGAPPTVPERYSIEAPTAGACPGVRALPVDACAQPVLSFAARGGSPVAA